MTRAERFKVVMGILDEGKLANCSRYHTVFEKLCDDDLLDREKVKDVLKSITEYENRCANPTSKYPEGIMQYLRQRIGLDEFDTSRDAEINEYSPSEAFSDVCKWHGLLGGYAEEIKEWIEGIYGIELDSETESLN